LLYAHISDASWLYMSPVTHISDAFLATCVAGNLHKRRVSATGVTDNSNQTRH
jgi:hypothetical protein